MALLWQTVIKGKNYQVRSAGSTVRLYTDGVFHSQFNPRYALGGSIWDLLVIPALFSPNNIQRILVLGLGGGAAVRALQVLLPNPHITAVEIDPVHIQVAKTYFGVKQNRYTRLINADAIAWLRHYKGEKFDFIVDDLFIETEGLPNRAVSTNDIWCNLLLRNLSPEGVLAINFDSAAGLRQSAFIKQANLSRSFASRYSLSTPGYDNRIAALFRSPQTKTNLKRTLIELEDKFGKNFSRRVNARIRIL